MNAVHQVKANGEGLRRVYRAMFCSINGFRVAWRYEAAFRQEVILSALLLVASYFVAASVEHWCFLITSLFILLAVEILNSAIETLADKITLQHDELIKRAKDLGSAAVFIALCLVFIIWGQALCAVVYRSMM